MDEDGAVDSKSKGYVQRWWAATSGRRCTMVESKKQNKVGAGRAETAPTRRDRVKARDVLPLPRAPRRPRHSRAFVITRAYHLQLSPSDMLSHHPHPRHAPRQSPCTVPFPGAHRTSLRATLSHNPALFVRQNNKVAASASAFESLPSPTCRPHPSNNGSHERTAQICPLAMTC
jgi:hypothetical protein